MLHPLSLSRVLVLALAIALPTGTAAALSPRALEDKLEGMILLGAFGDALGVPTECAGLQGHTAARCSCHLQPMRPDPCHSSEWGIWPNQMTIAGVYGASSDDSAWRFAILQRWLLEEARGAPLAPHQVTEANLEAWMVKREAALWAIETSSTETAVVRERKMLSDFLAMMDAAGRQPPSGNTRGDNRFFVPGQPVVFGSYMYLEIGAVLSSSRAGAAALDAFAQVRESRSLPPCDGRAPPTAH